MDTEIRRNRLIDFHSHFLPGIDDGAPDVRTGIDMLVESAEQGVQICIATPHCLVHNETEVEAFLKRREEANKALAAAVKKASYNIPEILLGAEVYLDTNISALNNVDKLCISGSNCMLLELPRRRLNRNLTEWIYGLITKDILPVMAHIERYDERQLDEIGIWDLPVIFQSNASEFLSMNSRRRLKRNLKRGVPFVIGSDMHNMELRPPCLRHAYKIARSKFSDIYDDIFFRNAKLYLFDIHE